MQDLFDSKISYIAKQSQMLFLLRSSESNSYGDHIIKKKEIQWKAGKETQRMRKTTSLPRRLFLTLGIPNLKAKLPATYSCF